LPTPSVEMAFMVTFTDLAAEAGAASRNIMAAAVREVDIIDFIAAPLGR
jgi:hypothetical protein